MTTEELEYVIHTDDKALRALTTQVKELNRQLGKGTLDAVSSSSNASKEHLTSVGRVAGRVGLGIVGALALGAGASVKLAGDFQSSLNKMQAVSNATGKEMKQVRDEAIKLGNDMTLPATSAKDAADAMTELSKSGFKAKDAMKAAHGVLTLSAAAGIENGRAAEIAANAINTFRLKAKDADFVVDQLAATANASSVEIEDVADTAGHAASVFSAFQGDTLGARGAMTELNTAIGLLGNQGIKGSLAGASLKETMTHLAGPTLKAKNEMLALFGAAKGVNITHDQMNAILRGGTKERDKAINALVAHNKVLQSGGDIAFDANGKMRPLHETIDLVTKATKNMTAEQRDAFLKDIFGTNAIKAVIALMQSGTKGWDNMSKAVQRHGAASDVAKSRMKGFNGAMEAFRSSLETMAIVFGTMMLPLLTSFLKHLVPIANWMSEHTTTVKILVGVLALFGTGLIALSAAVKIYTFVTNEATKATVKLLLALLTNPIFLIIAAIVALGVALVVAYKHSETFRRIVNAGFDAVKTAAKTVADFVTVKIPGAFKAVLDWVRDHWKTIAVLVAGPFAPMVLLATNAFGVRSKLEGAFLAVLNWVRDNWHTIATLISGPFAPLVALATNAFGVRSKLEAAFSAVKTFVGDRVTEMVGFVTSMPDRVAGGLTSLVNKFGPVKTVVTDIGDGLKWLFDHVAAGIEKVMKLTDKPLQKIADGFEPIATALGKIKDAIEWVIDHVDSIVDKFGKVGGVIGKVAGVLSKIGIGDVAAGFNSAAANAARKGASGGGGGGAAGPGGSSSGLTAFTSEELRYIQSHFGNVTLTSGFRTAAENAAAGGATNSDHLTGRAIDLVPSSGWSDSSIAEFDQIAAWAAAQPFVRWIGWRGVPGHGPYDHLHLSFKAAEGAVAMGPAVGLVGEGGSAPEVVLPLGSNYGRRLLSDALATALQKNGGGHGGMHVEHLHVNDEMDARLLARELHQLAVR